MRAIVLATVAVALSAASAAIAAPASPLRGQPSRELPPFEATIVNPDWASRPTASDMMRYYPRLAAVLSISGQVVLQCAVNSSGAMEACRIISEQPAALGFGGAALSLSSLFRMKPQTIDGEPVSGAKVQVPVAFKIAAGPNPTPLLAPRPKPGATVTPETTALALKILSATNLKRNMVLGTGRYIEGLKQEASQISASAEIEAMRVGGIQALNEALLAQADSYEKRVAEGLAAAMTPDELAKTADFMTSSAGKAWLEANVSSQPLIQAANRDAQQAAFMDARAKVCAKAGHIRSPIDQSSQKPGPGV